MGKESLWNSYISFLSDLPYASFVILVRKIQKNENSRKWGFGGDTLSERPEETSEALSFTSEFGLPPKLLHTFGYKRMFKRNRIII